jgi:hypothetical protein
MTDHCYDYGNDKVENGNGNTEPATPHPTLSRKGRGNDHNHDHNHNSKENGIKYPALRAPLFNQKGN